MDKTVSSSPVSIFKPEDASCYLPQVNRAETDADFYHSVSKNSEAIHALRVADQVIGLACMQEDDEGFIYIYIFPHHRRKGYGYQALQALEAHMCSGNHLNLSTAYDSRNEIAGKFARKCGFRDKFATAVLVYRGGKFDLPELPIRKHRDADFYEAYTMSAEAFHIMRLETGHDPNSVPYPPDEEARQYCAETAAGRYIYEENGEIIGCAYLDGTEISLVAIKTTHQGKGHGRLLVKFLVNRILEQNIGEPFLFCLVSNTKARGLYDSLGFTEFQRNVYAVKALEPAPSFSTETEDTV